MATTDRDPRPPGMAARMREATRLTRSGRLHEATQLIQRTLRGGSSQPVDRAPGSAGPSMRRAARPVTRVDSTVVRTERTPPAPPGPSARPGTAAPGSRHAPTGPDARSGVMAAGSVTTAAGTRDYRLYVPAGAVGVGSPLVVMLHGCTQSPEDFAAGTRMNALADRHGLVVAYPAQSRQANPSGCWNWFQPADQQRDRGEPSLIAAIVRRVGDTHAIDGARVYVAGMSAGAAMAVVLGHTHPDVFAAVGAHSGLPRGAATDLQSALRAMRQGAAPSAAPTPSPSPPTGGGTPTIVFHGDSDATVHRANAELVLRQATAGIPRPLLSVHQSPPDAPRPYTRYVYRDADGAALAEGWSVQGLGHAWSGGDPAGSYTDPVGPDASAEMVRFFAEHARG